MHSDIESALRPAGSGILDSEYRIVRPDEETRWIATYGRTFFELVAGQRTAIRFLGTMLDKTEQKLAQEALVQSEKLAVTGRLTVCIAHEIKNPLESLTNLLYVIRAEPSPEKRDEWLTFAGAELARLREIVSNTLHFHQRPVDAITMDVTELIESVLVLFRGRILSQQVRLQTELSSGVAAQAPQGELRQVLANLISNALDAMPTGGRLLVRARELTVNTGEKGVRLTVADTGVGMNQAVQSRAFEAFYTTKKTTGTGIGLWLSQEIIKKYGSKIQLKSVLGRGTVFSLYLSGSNKPPSDLLKPLEEGGIA